MPDKTLKGKTRHKTVDLDQDTVFGTFRVPFQLGEADFLRLTKIPSFVPIWAHSFFAGTAVFFVTLLAKVIDHKYFDNPESVNNVEWITFGILAVLAIGFEILNYKMPTEKQKVIDNISKHFEANKPQSAVRGGTND